MSSNNHTHAPEKTYLAHLANSIKTQVGWLQASVTCSRVVTVQQVVEESKELMRQALEEVWTLQITIEVN